MEDADCYASDRMSARVSVGEVTGLQARREHFIIAPIQTVHRSMQSGGNASSPIISKRKKKAILKITVKSGGDSHL